MAWTDRRLWNRPLLAVLVATTSWIAAAPAATDADAAALRFQERPLPVAETKLFDLGVADRGGDGRLDVYTLNHSYPQSWLERGPSGPFGDRTLPLGLSQDRAVPGWERVYGAAPPPDRGPGLYVYITKATLGPESRSNLVLEARGAAADGTIVLDPKRNYAPVALEGATLERSETASSDRIGFALAVGGRAEIQVAHLDLPIVLRSTAPARAPLLLGADAVAANGPQATVTLRDRHGYALGDLDRDGREDLFSVVGGLGGDIALAPFRGRVFDELLFGTRAGFGLETLPVPKDDCRGRQADLVDVDADGDADLFTSCEQADPAVLLQTEAGFRRSTIDGAAGSAYRWVAGDRDPRPELLVAGVGPARLVELGPGGWREQSRAPLRSGTAEVRSISVADFDGDGDADFFCASPAANTLLVGDGRGGIEPRNPARFGLPPRSAAASWVDVDLDGRLDLHALPQGLFLRTGAGHFRRTGELSARPATHALSLWADLDNDGRRDSIAAVGPGLMGPRHEVSLAINRSQRRGRWLELDLSGAMQTARISIRWAGVKHVAWAGQSDDSPFSQTHNRLYFGLGKGPGAGRARLRISGPGLDPIRRKVGLDRIVAIEAAAAGR